MHRLIIWECSNSETLRVQIFSQKTTFKHFRWPTAAFSLFCFVFTIWLLAFHDICYLISTPCLALYIPCWHAWNPHPTPSPPKQCCVLTRWLCPCGHSTTQRVFIELPLCELLATLSRTSASSPTRWCFFLVIPTHHLRNSLGDTSSKKPLLTVCLLHSTLPLSLC